MYWPYVPLLDTSPFLAYRCLQKENNKEQIVARPPLAAPIGNILKALERRITLVALELPCRLYMKSLHIATVYRAVTIEIIARERVITAAFGVTYTGNLALYSGMDLVMGVALRQTVDSW